MHLDLMLARLLGVLLAEPLTSSDGQGSPIVWLVKWKPWPDLLPSLHGFLDGPAVRHSRAANRTWVRHPAGEKHPLIRAPSGLDSSVPGFLGSLLDREPSVSSRSSF